MVNRLLIVLVSYGVFATAVPKDAYLAYQTLNQLVCSGDVNVIMGGDSDYNVVEYNPREAKVNISETGLIEIESRSKKSDATVVIRSNNRFKDLYMLLVRDKSSLIAKDVESDSLAVDTESSGNIMMEGVMNLNKLKVSSDSSVEIYWLDSKALDVVASKGEVILAGRTEFMSSRVTGSSKLDASGLISQRAWVAALDSAVLSVFPVKELFAYSKDTAVIDVKQKPQMFVPLNQAPSAIIVNYVEMEKRSKAQK